MKTTYTVDFVHEDAGELIVHAVVVRRDPHPDGIRGVVEEFTRLDWWRNGESCTTGGSVHVVRRSDGDHCLLCGHLINFGGAYADKI